MTNLYLSLLDHAVAELIEGYDKFERLQRMSSAKRTASAVAQAVISLHLGLDKAVKHGVATIDPAILMKGLSGEMIQRLQRERLQQRLPSILSVPGKDETQHLIGLLHIARPYFVPPIEDRIYEEYIGHVQDLVALRNQMVHKEFAGEFDHIATVLMQVLSHSPAVLGILAPDVLQGAYQQNDQLESRLKAVKLEVDAAWQVLVDYLREGHSLPLSITMWITIPPGSVSAQVSLTGRAFTGNGISAEALVARDAEDPLFLREMARRPPIQGLLGEVLVGRSAQTNPQGLGGIGRLLRPEPVVTEEKAITPTHGGNIEVRDVPARLSASLPNRKKSSVGVNINIVVLAVAFQAGEKEGSLRAVLAPAARSEKSESPAELLVNGTALLESEFAVSESSEHFVEGTTLRKISIDALLTAPE